VPTGEALLSGRVRADHDERRALARWAGARLYRPFVASVRMAAALAMPLSMPAKTSECTGYRPYQWRRPGPKSTQLPSIRDWLKEPLTQRPSVISFNICS